VLDIVAANGAPNYCELTATFRAAVSGKLVGQSVTAAYVPTTGLWACTSTAPVEVVPKACQ